MEEMTSMERVLTALSHKEPDRVPKFIFLTMHGARELGLSLPEYNARAENIAEGQIRMQKRYKNDVLVPYYSAAIEAGIWGCDIITRDDGPATAGEPIIQDLADIDSLEVPNIMKNKEARKTIRSIELLKEKTKDAVPILAVAISPFSLPVMQLGFDKYFDLMFHDEQRFWKLIELNKIYSSNWINAQLTAGAHAVNYFDPVSSPTIIPKNKYIQTGRPVASQIISTLNAAVAFHLASGRTLSIMEEIIQSGAKVMSISHEEDLSEAKEKARGRIALIGNLNGVEMRTWTKRTTEEKVREAITKAAAGGGFILSDSHGEIPFQVSETTIDTITESVQRWGTYPIRIET